MSSYGRALVVGFLNTLIIAALGIVGRDRDRLHDRHHAAVANFVISGVATVYVECIRNIPLLIQILIWYSAVLKPLPGPRQAINLGLPLPGRAFCCSFR